MITSSPSWRATSTVSSFDTSSTRMIRLTISWGMSAYVRSSVFAALYAGMTMTTLGSSIGGQNTVAAPTLAPMRSDRRPELATLVVAGAFVLALLAGLWIVRPFTVAPIGPDAAAPVIAWERLVAGHRLEGDLSQTSKPLLTAVYGVTYAIAG